MDPCSSILTYNTIMAFISNTNVLPVGKRVLKGICRLNKEKPFFSYIVMHFNLHNAPITEGMMFDTIAVNKYGELFYGEKWISTLTDAEIVGVLCHEAMHLAKGCFFRKGNRDAKIWNIASDCIINWYLVCEDITLPKDGFIPHKDGTVTVALKTYNCANKSTEQFYEELYKDATKIKSSCSNGKKGHGGFDVHLEGDQNGEGKNTGKDKGSASIKSQENKWKRIIVQAATIARERGSSPGFINEFIDDILNPKIDWRQRVRQFVTNEIPVDFCNRIPGRKFYGTGIWCPRVKRENIELMISIDCSGSTSQYRQEFVSEAVGVLRCYPQVKGRIICWDTEVNEANDIEVDTNTAVQKVKGMKLQDINGGTELSSYKKYCDKKGYKSRLHIILTDGIIEDTPVVPSGKILFVLTPDGKQSIIQKYGEVCNLKDRNNDYVNK